MSRPNEFLIKLYLARPEGFEPSLKVLETFVLPLHQRRMIESFLKTYSGLALPVGFEPTTLRLTGERTAAVLQENEARRRASSRFILGT